MSSIAQIPLGTLMGASAMYAGQISSMMGFTSTAIGIYAFADIYPSKQRYMLRWLAALVIAFGLSWGAKATHDYKLILRAMREPAVVADVYHAASMWPISMYVYGVMTCIVLVMIVFRKLLQVHKLHERVFGTRPFIEPEAEADHEDTSRICLDLPHCEVPHIHTPHDVEMAAVIAPATSPHRDH